MLRPRSPSRPTRTPRFSGCSRTCARRSHGRRRRHSGALRRRHAHWSRGRLSVRASGRARVHCPQRARPSGCPGTSTTPWPAGPCCATSAAARSTRLDVCDAHPELLRAGRHLGEPSRRDCPVCGARATCGSCRTSTATSSSTPTAAASANERELAKLGATYDEFACYVVEVCVDCRWNHLDRQSLPARPPCTAERSAAQRRPRRRRSPRPLRASSCGYCEQHETHHSSASSTTVSRTPAWSHVSGAT